jgi:hypothetical protein
LIARTLSDIPDIRHPRRVKILSRSCELAAAAIVAPMTVAEMLKPARAQSADRASTRFLARFIDTTRNTTRQRNV